MESFDVTLKASEGGSISGAQKVRWSKNAVYTITPDEGCKLVSLIVDGEEIELTYALTLECVKANHSIEAVFAPVNEEAPAETEAPAEA